MKAPGAFLRISLLVRLGDIRLADLDPLEQLDLLAFENQLTKIRFAEQAALMELSGQPAEAIQSAMTALAAEYWPDLASQATRRDAIQAERLIELQQETYTLIKTSSGAILEIK